jgi:membrane fusion protein, multidrug efflux system
MKARVAACVMGAALAAGGCSKQSSAAKSRRHGGKLEYPVEVAPLKKQSVRYSVTAPGSIEAFQQVQITARVAGAVDKVDFHEGEDVKVGQVMVVIESDRYRLAVGQAEAALAKAKATESEAEAELARRQGATEAHPGLISGEEVSSYATQVATGKADVALAEENVRVAQLNLRDSYVRSTIRGVVQTRTVQAGQYLQAGAVLATLLQRDPLLLRFQVTEQEAPRLKPGMTAEFRMRETPRDYSATITLVAGQADPQTRLVPVTARVDQTEHQYWLRPGAFCTVTVPIGTAREGIVIPEIAVQPTENGNVVYIDDKNVARQKVVSLGMHTPEGGVEVTQGLSDGDLLIVRGIEPLSDKAPINVTEKTTVEAIEQAQMDAGATPAPAQTTAIDPMPPWSGHPKSKSAPPAASGTPPKKRGASP